jgi:hypothetical protein
VRKSFRSDSAGANTYKNTLFALLEYENNVALYERRQKEKASGATLVTPLARFLSRGFILSFLNFAVLTFKIINFAQYPE